MIITIDPGVHACAVAWLEQSHLQGTKFHDARNDLLAFVDVGVSHVVVERPEYQGIRTQSSRPQDLINLAWAGALLAGRIAGATGAHLIELAPSKWKGSEPKPVHHARMWVTLTEQEKALLGGDATGRVIQSAVEKGARERWKKGGAAYYPRTWTMHNILDAAALGLHYVGRMAKR